MNTASPFLAAAVAVALSACSPPPAPTGDPSPTPAPSTAPPRGASETDAGAPFERWTGRWTGPEGTYLDIEPDRDGYAIAIANLDGPRRFHARAAGDRLVFERDGQSLAIRATDGPGTGMKWLQDRTDCLVVAPGEGFCR